MEVKIFSDTIKLVQSSFKTAPKSFDVIDINAIAKISEFFPDLLDNTKMTIKTNINQTIITPLIISDKLTIERDFSTNNLL